MQPEVSLESKILFKNKNVVKPLKTQNETLNP
jgi:hypothetical protein